MSYCKAIGKMESVDRKRLHQRYHDKQYGFPIQQDDELFGRLLMEINQAGLSWETILKKEDGFRRAYKNFHIQSVASFNESDIERLMLDPSIVRNRLKVNAAIFNAKKILEIQKAYTGIG
jgi:DNA-3-methyladenine glycosylase I